MTTAAKTLATIADIKAKRAKADAIPIEDHDRRREYAIAWGAYNDAIADAGPWLLDLAERAALLEAVREAWGVGASTAISLTDGTWYVQAVGAGYPVFRAVGRGPTELDALRAALAARTGK